MNRKRFRVLTALILCIIMFVSCGDEAEMTLLKEWDNNKEANSKPSEVNGSGIKIGMVTDEGGIEDRGFNESAWDGLLAMQKKTGVSIMCLESKGPDDYYNNFVQLCENGCNLCWGVGFACADALLQAAKDYPDVSFAIIDSEYENTPDNVTGVVFRAQEVSFIVGYIAASASKKKKVGFIGGVKSETLDQFEYGYKAGVAYYNFCYSYLQSVEVVSDYIGSFTDDQKAFQMAIKMYDDGCDVIYGAAGLATLQILSASSLYETFSIGVDKDQAYYAPDHVLTSAMKNVDTAIQIVSRDFIDKRQIGGKTFSFGFAEGAVGIPEHHDNYTGMIYDYAIVMIDMIKSGELVPPYNEETYYEYIATLVEKEFGDLELDDESDEEDWEFVDPNADVADG